MAIAGAKRICLILTPNVLFGTPVICLVREKGIIGTVLSRKPSRTRGNLFLNLSLSIDGYIIPVASKKVSLGIPEKTWM